MLDVKRLRVLREVAAQGSFSAAAEALAYTQSAVSQQIAALEREAGSRLVERTARGVHLTDAGEALVRHAEAILARLADAEAELEAMAGLKGGRLRIVAFPSAGATLAPRAIASFRDRHPAVDLTLIPGEPEDGLAALKCGDTDIALLIETGFDRIQDDGIERTHVMTDPMYLLLPAGHPLAQRRRVRMEDLAGESWITGSSMELACPDGRILVRACRGAGFEPQIAFNSEDYLAIQGFVAAGMGISLVPDLALLAVRDDVVVRSLGNQAPAREIIAATLEGGYCSPAKQAMLEILCEVGREFEGKRETLALAS
jgi:DNA-binding transcriptional LysR family regulator